MSDIAIKVENISKAYRILHKQKNESDSLIAAFAGGLKNMFKAEGGQTHEDFWALKDISFEVKAGDRVGIIGRNGAGKSTLLKILSRIVKPTGGRIEYQGRMASLLEVGTGFHGDLTGRENIYLNGSILGMSKREIDSQFDAIVDFSEVEKFLDTPVKRYSSGMYVRLAFAVAAHLNPEILIVDEVLAVGDAAFQKKCLGKMNEISKSDGRTILFVSHSMQSVQKICNVGVFLQSGKLIEQNHIDKIVNLYLQSGESGQAIYDIPTPANLSYGFAQKVFIENMQGEALYEVPVGSEWRVRILFKILKPTEHFIIGLGIVSSFDQPLRTSWSEPKDMQPGEYEMTFDHHDILFTTGVYKLVIGLSSNVRTFQYIDDVVNVFISDAGDAVHNSRIVNTSSGLILNPMNVNLKKLN
ncbi:MAG: transporter, ATP-binding protein [Bacteroidetes bacterium]|nr:transporter, ATP-binding protein [Bacteroidota bacterium]